MEMRDFDVVVVGGGLVGCSLACALAPQGLSVALVDAGGGPVRLDADPRKLALAAASLTALGRLGVLSRLATPPTPIERLHVSREGDFGALDVAARDAGRDAFGGVVLAGDLGAALQQAVGALPGVTSVRGTASLGAAGDDGWHALEIQPLDAEQAASSPTMRWRARLVVASDGTASPLRAAAGIGVDTHDYGQTLIVTSVRMGAATPFTAYERLTTTGPCALLPMARGRHGALLGVASADADAVMALDDRAFAEAFQRRAGWRAGAVREVGTRSAWPLRRAVATSLVAERLVLVGNAAQTIHPIGAQGFNLGLRDALSLVDVLSESQAAGATDAGDATVLANYVERRRVDRAETLAFSDGLARITAGESLLHRFGRSLGFAAMTLDSGLRAGFINGAMGFRGRIPALARDAA
jgi:2-octaprenyl-6-methoxyphenol hydroxylase